MRRTLSAVLYPAWLIGAFLGAWWVTVRWLVAAGRDGFDRAVEAKPPALWRTLVVAGSFLALAGIIIYVTVG